MNDQKLTARNLKEVLWTTLNKIEKKELNPSEGDAIASQAREILRTTNVQLRISSQSGRQVGSDLIAFSED